jgi:hypothetical protein
MKYDQLDFGELQNVADLYVTADHERNFSVGDSDLEDACNKLNLVAIFDAESELVCLAPSDKVDLMARLINTYVHSQPTSFDTE